MAAVLREEQLKVLMLRSLAGDSAAYGTLLSALARELNGYFRYRLGDQRAEAEDLTQETLLAIHRKRETYDPDQPFTAWVFAIARHKLIDWSRHRNLAPMTTPIDNAPELQDESPGEDPTTARDLSYALQCLPEKQAAAIRLTRLDGLSVSEASALSGQSESAIKVAAHRGLKKLLALFGSTK